MANPTLLTMPLCVNADKNTIPPTDAGTSGLFSEEYGWQNINSLPLASGGKAPNRRDFNGVFALLGGIAYACQRGYTFEWVNTLPYLAGCVVTDPLDGKKYNALNDIPSGGTNPSLDPTNWEKFGTDTTVLANTDLSNLTQTGQDSFLERDFTIIYPNGGSEASPANIAVGNSYVESNPFPGYYVMLQVELQYNDVWYPVVDGYGYIANGGLHYHGTMGVQTDANSITILTAKGGTTNSLGSCPLDVWIPTLTTAPCRVKVWKVGKIPT